MNLSKVAIMALRGSGVDFKKKLAEIMEVSEKTLYRYLISNDDNLTKAAALKAISEETGLSQEELLEGESIETAK